MRSKLDYTTEDANAARERLHALIARADFLSDRDTEHGFALAVEAEQLAVSLGDDEERANALYSISQNLTMQGKYTLALEYLTRAQAILEHGGFTAHLPKTLWLTGKVHNSLGTFAEALQAFTRGLTLAQAQSNRTMEVRTLTGMASVYTWLDDYDTAADLLERTLALARSLPDYPDVGGSAMHALARIRIASGRMLRDEGNARAETMFDQAMALLDETFALAKVAENVQLMTVCNLSRASVAIERDDPALARRWLAYLDADTAQLRAARYQGSHLTFLGQANALEGDHHAALKYYELARAAYEGINAQSYLRRVHQFISASYEALGDSVNALAHFKRFHEYDRVIKREQTRQQAMVLAVRLDLERAKYEAEMHRTRSVTLTALNNQLREKVIRDPLTGLFNRRYLEEILARELVSAHTAALPVSIVTVDLDHFKEINDTYGHAAGDRMLQAISDLLLSQTRLGDAVCRLGGEEFVVVLPGADADAAWQWAEQRRFAFATLRVTHEETEMHGTFSAGVATAPKDGSTADTLLQTGDRALYAAKHAGRNCVVTSGE